MLWPNFISLVFVRCCSSKTTFCRASICLAVVMKCCAGSGRCLNRGLSGSLPTVWGSGRGKWEKGGGLDQELIEAMFQSDGRAGCYRSYIPLERIDASELPYRKLKAFDVERGILLSIAQQGVALLNLGVIIGNPAESYKSLSRTEERMLELKNEILDLTGGRTYPFANFFLHIPICGTNDYRLFHKEGRLAFDIDTNPELYKFYTSLFRGD